MVAAEVDQIPAVLLVEQMQAMEPLILALQFLALQIMVAAVAAEAGLIIQLEPTAVLVSLL